MKAIITVAVAFFAVGALGGSLYNEKEEIKQEVTQMYDEAIKKAEKMIQEIATEQGKTEKDAVDDAKAEGVKQKDKTLEQLNKDVTATTRSAIARGKPVTAIECISKTFVEGKKLLSDTLTEYTKAVEDVKMVRDGELDLEKSYVELIKTALAGLKAESLEKINNEKVSNNLKALKADASKKVATANKQLTDIETRIAKQVIKGKYADLKKKIAAKYKEIGENLLRRLQKCIA